MLRIVVLGSAAGGGFPQWNSNAPGCRRARGGDPRAKRRTQASLAVTADDENWVLLNASPDLRQQIEATPSLHPRHGKRSSPVAAVVLTGGDVDAIAGLLHLRERHAFAVYATDRVHEILRANPIFDVLAPDCVARHELPLGLPLEIARADGAPLGLVVKAFAVPGKVPLYLERPDHDATPVTGGGDTIGLELSEATSGSRFFFIPGCAMMTEDLRRRLHGAPLVFFDGTLWTDDEMIREGLGRKTGKRMGHMSIADPDGVIAAFRDLRVDRRVLIHINNSNPVLLEDSAEARKAAEAGWEVAYDGMEIAL